MWVQRVQERDRIRVTVLVKEAALKNAIFISGRGFLKGLLSSYCDER